MPPRRPPLLAVAVAVALAFVPPPAAAAPPNGDGCRVAADSILGLDGSGRAGASWDAPGASGAIRRLSALFGGGAARNTCLATSVEKAARDAVAAHPDAVDSRYALAVVLGLRADREGGRSKVRAAAELYDQLKAILALDPGHVGAHHLLGRLEAGVMRMDRVTRWIATNLLGGRSLKGANWTDAERNLEFAVQAAPEVPDYHFELARLYEDTGRLDLARREARRVLAMDSTAAMEETVPEKAEALVDRLATAHGSPTP